MDWVPLIGAFPVFLEQIRDKPELSHLDINWIFARIRGMENFCVRNQGSEKADFLIPGSDFVCLRRKDQETLPVFIHDSAFILLQE